MLQATTHLVKPEQNVPEGPTGGAARWAGLRLRLKKQPANATPSRRASSSFYSTLQQVRACMRSFLGLRLIVLLGVLTPE